MLFSPNFLQKEADCSFFAFESMKEATPRIIGFLTTWRGGFPSLSWTYRSPPIRMYSVMAATFPARWRGRHDWCLSSVSREKKMFKRLHQRPGRNKRKSGVDFEEAGTSKPSSHARLRAKPNVNTRIATTKYQANHTRLVSWSCVQEVKTWRQPGTYLPYTASHLSVRRCGCQQTCRKSSKSLTTDYRYGL